MVIWLWHSLSTYAYILIAHRDIAGSVLPLRTHLSTRWFQRYFLQYTPGQTPMISKEYQAMFEGKFLRDNVSKISVGS